ncbi:hypothetical protein ABH942_001275 [Flavobacterium sp. 28YEA47A]|uniref:hypothetical protein n=1 Tax=Flavobacterium sp. 28YEA47A TaxID=3156276 RepID=UPI0035124B0F
MSQFNLKIAFTTEQLRILYTTGTNVIIAKQSDGRSPSVAWQVIRPMQTNSVSWKEEYGIYASTAEIRNGAVLSQLANTLIGIETGKQYILQSSGAIIGPHGGGFPNAFMLSNQYSGMHYMVAGLFQDAIINGINITNNAVSATPVLMQSNAIMNPNTTIQIWLQSQVVGNSVVTNITSPITELKFGGNITDISIAYDSESGKFVPAKSGTLKSSSEPFNYIEPSL